MTPKQKAKELKKLFDGNVIYASNCVDEIIKEHDSYNKDSIAIIYFEEVKKYINV